MSRLPLEHRTLPGLLLSLALLALFGSRADAIPSPLQPSHSHHCGGGMKLVISEADRFDPLVQQLRVQQQLEQHPRSDQPRYLVIPYHDDGRLTEAQIRYLEQLLREARQQ